MAGPEDKTGIPRSRPGEYGEMREDPPGAKIINLEERIIGEKFCRIHKGDPVVEGCSHLLDEDPKKADATTPTAPTTPQP